MWHHEDCPEHHDDPTAAPAAPIDGPLAEGRLALAPHYAVLRRAVGQLGGLLLLYRTGRNSRVEEIACSLDGVRTEWREAVAGLRAATPTAAMRRIQVEMLTAARLVGRATDILDDSLKATGGGVAAADAALVPLRRAQRILLGVSDDRFGMGMVSYATACCCSQPLDETHLVLGGTKHG
jgi:hypothetical protein